MSESTLPSSEALNPVAQEALFNYYGLGHITSEDHFGSIPRPNSRGTFNAATQRAYPFTTENMAGYLDELDLAGKDVLAICGSNDFALNAFQKGARSVDAVDAMQTACLYGELKTAGLVTYDYDEFLAFFNSPEAATHLDPDQYQRLRPLVSEQTRDFFDQLLSRQTGEKFNKFGFFIDKICDSGVYRAMNPYLRNPESYGVARANVQRILFHPVGMTEFLQNARPDTYDVIYCSNIVGYMSRVDAEDLATLAATRIRPGGMVLDFSFIHPHMEMQEFEDAQQRLAEVLNLSARHVVSTVPHMDQIEPGDSGYQSFLSILERAA